MVREWLIDQVKKRKWMYDKKHEEYVKRKEWFELLAQLYNHEHSQFSLQASGSELMSIWDQLYSNFKKQHEIVSNAPSGSSAKILNITKDPLYQSLLFVKDSVKPRPPLSSLDNFGESSSAVSDSFTKNMNLKVWQVKSDGKRKSVGRNKNEPGKFKKSKYDDRNELSDTKELVGTMTRFIEKATNDISQVVKQDNHSTEPFDEKKVALKNMLTKKFLKLPVSQIEPAFKEIRRGIIVVLGESNTA